MKSRSVWFIMLLALAGSARGQTAYTYRYWFDDDLSTLKQGSAQGLTTIEADISKLTKGTVHALHVQGRDERQVECRTHAVLLHHGEGSGG